MILFSWSCHCPTVETQFFVNKLYICCIYADDSLLLCSTVILLSACRGQCFGLLSQLTLNSLITKIHCIQSSHFFRIFSKFIFISNIKMFTGFRKTFTSVFSPLARRTEKSSFASLRVVPHVTFCFRLHFLLMFKVKAAVMWSHMQRVTDSSLKCETGKFILIRLFDYQRPINQYCDQLRAYQCLSVLVTWLPAEWDFKHERKSWSDNPLSYVMLPW